MATDTAAFGRNGRLGRALAAATLVAVLGGCAIGPQSIRTEVTTFNQWAALPADRSYAFSRTLEWQNSLEVGNYEDLVRDELALQGFRPAPDPAQANLIVTLRPSVTTTSVRVRSGWGDPFWNGGWGGPWGGYYGGFYGRGFGPYGWPGYYPGFGAFDGMDRIDVYHRRLELDIDSRAVPGQRYYEGRVENDSNDASLPQVMPVLVRALFTDFPGNNGQTRRIDVPVEHR